MLSSPLLQGLEHPIEKDTAPRKERCLIFSSYYASVHYLLLRLFLPFSNDNIVLEVIAPPIAADMVMIQINNAMLSPVEGLLLFPSTAKSAPRLAPSTAACVPPTLTFLAPNTVPRGVGAGLFPGVTTGFGVLSGAGVSSGIGVSSGAGV